MLRYVTCFKNFKVTMPTKWITEEKRLLALWATYQHPREMNRLAIYACNILYPTKYDLRNLEEKKYCDYISQIQQSVKQNTKRLLSFAKSKQTNVDTPNSMEYNSTEASSPADIAEIVSDYFSYVFSSVDLID